MYTSARTGCFFILFKQDLQLTKVNKLTCMSHWCELSKVPLYFAPLKASWCPTTIHFTCNVWKLVVLFCCFFLFVCLFCVFLRLIPSQVEGKQWLNAGGQITLSCIYGELNAGGQTACLVHLQIIKNLAWKPSYNRAIVEQGIKSSWSTCCNYTWEQQIRSWCTFYSYPAIVWCWMDACVGC